MVDLYGYSEDFLQLRTSFTTSDGKRKGKYTCFSKTTKSDIIAEIKDKQTPIEEIATRLNCSKRNIRNWLKHTNK